MNDFKQEREYLREKALRNLAFDELTILDLNDILLRIYNIGYFEGRKDGEKMNHLPTEIHLSIREKVNEWTSNKQRF